MKERGLVVVLAFLLAIGATAAVFLYVNGVKHDATSGGTTTQVIVSKQVIPSGTNLDGLVSSGAFVAAGLANGLDTAEMCRIFVTCSALLVASRPLPR